MPYARPPSLWLRPAAIAAASVILGSGVIFGVSKYTPTGTSVTRDLFSVKSQSGSTGVAIRETGVLDASGSVITDATLSGRTLRIGVGGADIHGPLNVTGAVNVRNVLSGSSLVTDRGGSQGNNVVCILTGGTLGYCSTQPDANGNCFCQ